MKPPGKSHPRGKVRMIGDIVLRLPTQAQAQRLVGRQLPLILGKEPHVNQVDAGQRVAGIDHKLGRPAGLAGR